MGRDALKKELIFLRSITSDRYKAIEYDAQIALLKRLDKQGKT